MFTSLSIWPLMFYQGAPVARFILECYGRAEVRRAVFRPAMYYAGSMSLGSAAFVVAIQCLMAKDFFVFI
jgi:hypothetical protein